MKLIWIELAAFFHIILFVCCIDQTLPKFGQYTEDLEKKISILHLNFKV